MPEINESKLREHIQRNSMSRVYFLYGEEKMLVRRDLLRLTKKLDTSDFPQFNFNAFPHTASVDDIADAVMALPFMAEQKCVTVSDLNVDALSPTENSKLTELVENVPDTTVLIFALPTLDIDTKRSAKWRNFLKKVETYGDSVCYARRSDGDLVKYLCREAEKQGCSLSRTLAEKIISYAGNDLNTLANEINKLCAYSAGEEITSQQVEDIVTKNMETTVFLLSNALVRGDYSKAYSLLDMLISQGEEPIAILAVLSSAYIDMYRVRAAIDSGKTSMAPAEYGDYKGRDFRLKYAERDMRDLSLEVLRDSLELLLDCDLTLKMSGGDSMNRIALEKLFSKLLLAANRGRGL